MKICTKCRYTSKSDLDGQKCPKDGKKLVDSIGKCRRCGGNFDLFVSNICPNCGIDVVAKVINKERICQKE